MFKKTSAEEQQLLENITAANKHLLTLAPDSDEYKKTLKHVQTLYTILTELRGKKQGVEPWIPFFGHLGGVSIIAFTESMGHVITSKAMALTSPFRNKS